MKIKHMDSTNNNTTNNVWGNKNRSNRYHKNTDKHHNDSN